MIVKTKSHQCDYTNARLQVVQFQTITPKHCKYIPNIF